jgi:peptide/nickel transport system substrate-binding protein
MVEFSVLGPLEARGPNGAVTLGGRQARLLLSVLIVHADEVVSRSAIVDALWPEQPPPSATQAIESYVSRLRGALRKAGVEQEIIVSAPGGYRLARAGNRFDCDVFTKHAVSARAALERGELQAAVNSAHEALALWRGSALADIANEPGVCAEAAALEERRLQVIETRAEAALALGRHAQQISELRAEALRHPARERVHELLMLALYRAGRQAEALEVYRAAHDHLGDELGLEPGHALRALELSILRQDPALAAPLRAAGSSQVRSAAAEPGWHIRGIHLGLGAAFTAAIAGMVLLLASGGSGAAITRTLQGPALGVFGGQSGLPKAAVALATAPSAITAGLGAEWATSYDDGTLLRINPSDSAVVQTVYVGNGPTGVAVDAGDVWVADSLDNRVTRVNADTNQVVQQIPVGTDPVDVAAGAGAIWVANRGDGTVSRLDPLTGDRLGLTAVGAAPSAIAIGAGAVWVTLSGAGSVERIDPSTGRLLTKIRVGSDPSAIAVSRGDVWVANELDSTVSLIDPKSNRVVLTRGVAGTPIALAARGTSTWVAGGGPFLTMVRDSGQTRARAIPSPVTALASGPSELLVGAGGTGADHRGGTLVVRIAGPIEEVNPQGCCAGPPQVEMLAYDSLLAYSKSPASPDTLVPDLALAIPRAQDDGLVYTFHLRPGLRYWTGAPVLATDIRRGLERAAQSSSIYSTYLSALPGALACSYQPHCNLDQAVQTNDRARTVTLHLTHPDPDLLPALGLTAFAPVPPGRGITPGTGPYRVARFIPGKLIDFQRNRYFNDWASTAQPPGYPNQILVYSNGTASADVAAVLGGRADYTFDYPTRNQLEEIHLRFPGLLHTNPLPDTDELILNTREAPFSHVLVRQALNFAIDRKAIVALYGGPQDATPTCQIIPATIPGHVPYCPYTVHPSASRRWTAPDLARARRLIAESGTSGEAVTVLTEAPSGPWDEPVGRYTVGLLRKLGYRARLEVATPNFNAAINNYHHPPQIVTNSWIADHPAASQWITIQLSCGAWHPPTQLQNHAEFCEPAIDRLADQASLLQLTDPVAADRVWARADRDITNLAPWVPTVTATETDLVSQRVGDYQYVPTIGGLLDQLWVR